MNELTARHTFVGEDAENELFMVSFAEEEGEEGERLDIQRAFAFDDQDRSLGQDRYCLVSRDGVHCGGVTSWSLTGNVLTLAFDEKCSKDLDVDGGYEILMVELCEKLVFPGYFGFNWNALDECLCDLEWIAVRRVLLVHEAVPSLAPADLALYIDVLAQAVRTSRGRGGAGGQELIVTFPASAQAVIRAVMR